ncbi:MAG TPA: hypothetical protein PLF13_00620 [candidate division Zixibacteria bacterium]|nr:hypothetical protein [candidate division Zixibacteria bacterium]
MKRTDNDLAQIDRKIEQTLAGLDTTESIETGPHFYTRLMAKIKETESGEINPVWLSLFRGRLAASLLSLVILLNAVTTIMVIRNVQEDRNEYRRNNVEAVANEYSLPSVSETLDLAQE